MRLPKESYHRGLHQLRPCWAPRTHVHENVMALSTQLVSAWLAIFCFLLLVERWTTDFLQEILIENIIKTYKHTYLSICLSIFSTYLSYSMSFLPWSILLITAWLPLRRRLLFRKLHGDVNLRSRRFMLYIGYVKYKMVCHACVDYTTGMADLRYASKSDCQADAKDLNTTCKFMEDPDKSCSDMFISLEGSYDKNGCYVYQGRRWISLYWYPNYWQEHTTHEEHWKSWHAVSWLKYHQVLYRVQWFVQGLFVDGSSLSCQRWILKSSQLKSSHLCPDQCCCGLWDSLSTGAHLLCIPRYGTCARQERKTSLRIVECRAASSTAFAPRLWVGGLNSQSVL